MKKIIQFKLKFLAKLILSRYKPDVIGVTGSVGKSSTREAIFAVLSPKFSVRESKKNYNNELGVPLTIIGSDSPGKCLLGWFGVFLKAAKLILLKDKNYPKILILEMGVDRPGDMDYLLSIVRPRIGVITRIGPSHMEFFGSLNKIKKEKESLVKNLANDGIAVINADDELCRDILKNVKTRAVSYGFEQSADMQGRELKIINMKESGVTDHNNSFGLNFKLMYKGSTVPVLLPNVVGRGAAAASLAASAVAIIYDFNLIDVSKALREIKWPRGRMNLVPGIKKTLIIDDTYNSSPQSLEAALQVAGKIELLDNAQKFAVLGDMLELGRVSEEAHRQAGKQVVETGIAKLILVGERARDIGRGAQEAGMKKDDIFNFATAEEAGIFVQDRIKQNDLILIKGSQGMRMEKVVLEIMADPLQAADLLVRQDEQWDK